MGVTPKQLERMLRSWQPRLGLERWEIRLVVRAASEESCYMEVERSIYYERAELVVQPWLVGRGEPPEAALFTEVDEAFIEASLVHELLHLVLRDLAMVIRDDLDGFLHRDVHAQLHNGFRRAEEQAVDRLACALVQAWRAA